MSNKKIITAVELVLIIVLAVVIGIGINKIENKESDAIVDNIIENSNPEGIKNNTLIKDGTYDIGEVQLDSILTQYDTTTAEVCKSDIEEINTIKQIEDTNREKSITRYEFIQILYEIIVAEGKLPNIHGYNAKYSDSADIPTQYLTAVVNITYIGVIDFGDKLDGYKYITSGEVSDAYAKLRDYIEFGYLEYEDSNVEENTAGADNTEPDEVEFEARDYEDTLNGQSVAVFKNPKTPDEVRINMESLTVTDITSSSIRDRYIEGDAINFDYITVDQGLNNPSKVSDKSIAGIAMGNELDMVVSFGGMSEANDSIIFKGDNLDKVPFLGTCGGIIGIKDNTVVSSGEYYYDHMPYIVMQNKEIDSLGIVIDKGLIENGGDISNINVLYIIKLSKNDIGVIEGG